MATSTLPDMSATLEHADEVARAAARRLAAAGHHLQDQAQTAREDVRDRLDDVDLEPVVRRARIGGWQLLRAVVGIVAVLPRLLVRGLGALSSAVDELADRGADVTERAREVASAVPPPRGERRRSRLRTAAWTGAGFGVGLGVGWMLARRVDAPVDDVDEDASFDFDVSLNGPVVPSPSSSTSGQRR